MTDCFPGEFLLDNVYTNGFLIHDFVCWKYPLHIITLPIIIQNHIYNLLYFLIKLYNEKY